MKILIIDTMAASLDFAIRCMADGHEVRVWMSKDKKGDRYPVGDGLIDKVSDWQSSMKWADLVFLTDNVEQIRELERYREEGFPIFGCNCECQTWELERGIGQNVLTEAGIKIMESTVFTNYDKAKEFVLKTGKRYVSKPTGDADKALSYVSKGVADMIFMLDYWKQNGKIKSAFLLQEFTPGIEMAVGGWFGKNGFSGYVLENFEFKKLMNGDVGVNTGEMGTAMKYVPIQDSKLAQEMLIPIQGALYRAGYTGFIDVSVIIDEKGQALPLEFTCRPGWPLFQIQQALHPEPVCWMKELLEGEDCFKPSLDIALGVVIAIPDFPYTTLTRKEVSGFPIWGITEKNIHNIHLSEVMLGELPVWENGKLKVIEGIVSAGDYLLTCSGTGKSVSEAKEKAYKVVKSLEIPNSPMYRTDIGDRLEKQLPILQELGYATDWKF